MEDIWDGRVVRVLTRQLFRDQFLVCRTLCTCCPHGPGSLRRRLSPPAHAHLPPRGERRRAATMLLMTHYVPLTLPTAHQKLRFDRYAGCTKRALLLRLSWHYARCGGLLQVDCGADRVPRLLMPERIEQAANELVCAK